MPGKAVNVATMTLTERYDPGALAHIIRNFASYNFRPETDTKAALNTLRRYKAAASIAGSKQVVYRQLAHGHGRMFAVRGLSMQGMPREIRNAIAHRLHVDVDFENCHPSLLFQFCRRHLEHMPCPRLEEYVADRDGVLGVLGGGKGGKGAVLAVINGGAVESPRRGVDLSGRGGPWLRAFAEEMEAVRQAVVEVPSIGAMYLDLARKSVAKKKGGGDAGSGGEGYNVLGSAVNHLLCDLEHGALMALVEYLERDLRRTVCALMFDGCMVERVPGDEDGTLAAEVLQAASDAVFMRTGYRLRVVVKDMAADMLEVPDSAYTGLRPRAAAVGAASAAEGGEEGGDEGGEEGGEEGGRKHADLVAGLRGIGGPLGGLPDSCVFSKVKDGLTFQVEESVEALMHRDSTRIFTTDAAYLGAYCGEFTTDVSFGNLHKDIPPDVDKYRCTVREKVTVLDADGGNVRLSLYNSQTPQNARIELAVRGKSDSSITAPAKIKSLMTVLADHVDKELRRRLGPDSLQLFSLVNHGTINVINVLDPDANRHTDEQLVKAVIAANPELLVRYCFAPDAKVGNCNGLYVCDRDTNVWAQKHNVAIEATLVDMFAKMELTDADRRHVESRRGGNDMIYKLAGKVVDERFLDRLDANPDLFAVDNGVFDMREPGGVFRPIATDDWVGTTAGWAYSKQAALDHRAELEAFLAQVLPVQEEREAVLAYFAGLLSGRRLVRKFMVFTDRRAGANGKSSLAHLLGSFFGAYAKTSTKFVCRGAFERDRDSHGAGTEPFRGKRLVVAEELKHSMTLDVALLKKLTGGASARVEDRRIGVGEWFKFTWQAGFLLIFNEGDCPNFDAGDAAFLERMIVAPMRAKFVAAGEEVEEAPEAHTFELDPDVAAKFTKWMPAMMDVLLEKYASGVAPAVPPSMRSWRSEISSDNNPVGSWVDKVLEVTGDREDYVLMADLKSSFTRSSGICVPKQKVTETLKAYLGTLQGVAVKECDKVPFNGGWKTVSCNVRGVAWRR